MKLEDQVCSHCHGLVAQANPSGFCNHIRYPKFCDVCTEGQNKKYYNPNPIYYIKRNKFRNIKTTIDNIKFDSIKESNRYCELKLLQKAGEIYDLTLQPKFELLPSFKHEGVLHRKIEYIADFMYKDKSGIKIVEDVKSEMTKNLPVYRIKKKLLLFKYKDFKFLET